LLETSQGLLERGWCSTLEEMATLAYQDAFPFGWRRAVRLSPGYFYPSHSQENHTKSGSSKNRPAWAALGWETNTGRPVARDSRFFLNKLRAEATFLDFNTNRRRRVSVCVVLQQT
jgi:hypothetical protein